MIELTIADNQPAHLSIKERLEAMSLAFKLRMSSLKEPVLKDNLKVFEGVEEVNEHVTYLEAFKQKWYECRCDKWEFDD